jgi:hypothetical protein
LSGTSKPRNENAALSNCQTLWAKDGARAYLGYMMPGFPNLWSIYGPNTNGALNVASFHEKVALYALQCMETLVLGNGGAMEVRPDAFWRYNRLVDERNLTKVWSDPRAHNYYWTEHGRSATMNPFYTAEMSGFLRNPTPPTWRSMDGGGVNLTSRFRTSIASIEPTGCREYRSKPRQLSSHPLPSRKQDSDGGHGTSMVLPRSPHGGFVGHFMGG